VSQRGTDDEPPRFKEADRSFEKGPASETVLSLSQALLAPLDAILKAQVHAARSFLSFLLQIGYPHQPTSPSGGGGAPGAGTASAGTSSEPAAPEGLPYTMDFYHDVPNGGRQKLSIPTLALVPLNPLGVKEAHFQFDFYVRQIGRHNQIMAAEKEALDEETAATQAAPTGPMDRQKRPWYLVDTPLSVRGTFAPSPMPGSGSEANRVEDARFRVEVKVGALPLPAALEKLMVALGQVSRMQDTPTKDR
jgi:hypothetical protein